MTNKEAIEIISRYEVNGCGYCHQGGDEVLEAFGMAISALKGMEPRVMTIGDLYGEDIGFYERKWEECVWPVLIARGGPDCDGTVVFVRKDAFEIKADCGLMNQTWRIWTAYPSKEQREAAEWQ